MARGGAEGASEGGKRASERGGRGGRGSRGGRGPASREVLMSKKLSWLLRHGAEKEGLKLGKGGFVNLHDVLENRNVKSFGRPTLAEIRTIVADNDKQRYTLIHQSKLRNTAEESSDAITFAVPTQEDVEQDNDPSHYLIRANQGHSLKVDEEGLLTPITVEAANLPAVVVHGTRHDAWAKILASGGLKPMGRNHVHFATGVPDSLKAKTASTNIASDDQVVPLEDGTEAPKVLSGMRNSSTILIFLNLRAALDSGLEFNFSANGVVLSKGDARGLIGVEFFEKVEEKGGNILMQDGKVVGEATVRVPHKKPKK